MRNDELSEHEKGDLLARYDLDHPDDVDINLVASFLYWVPFAKLQYIPGQKRRALGMFANLPDEDIDVLPEKQQSFVRGHILNALIVGYQAALQLGEPLIDMDQLRNDPEW